MKKTAIKTATVVVLAMVVLAGVAFAGQGGGGRAGGGPVWEGGRGRGGGPGWERWMAGEPQTEANLETEQPDNSWVPGPYCPWGQGPNQNIQDWQGPGPYCPFSQGPNQNIQGRQRPGQGGFGQNFQGPRGPYCPYYRGFGRWNMMMQREPMAGRGGGGPAIRGRGFQRGDIAPQGRGMNNWPGQPGPGGIGRQGPGMQPRRFAPADTDQTNQPMPPRGRGWTPGWGPGWTPNVEPNQQPEKAPDANAPAAPAVEDQPAKPQGE